MAKEKPRILYRGDEKYFRLTYALFRDIIITEVSAEPILDVASGHMH